jgi:hypothetical protein
MAVAPCLRWATAGHNRRQPPDVIRSASAAGGAARLRSPLLLLGLLAAGTAWAQAAPVETVADAVRDRGHPCDQAISAERDQAADRPDEAVWILTCSNARYRVRFPGDTAPQVERLD